MALTAIPNSFGSGGANMVPGGAQGVPTLASILQEHVAAIEALQGAEGEVVQARFALVGNRTLSGVTTTNTDGITPVVGNIVLVPAQSDTTQNGLYVVAAGAWTRLKDGAGNDVIESGMLVQVSEGTANADKVFELTTNAPITVGTTPLAFGEANAAGALATTSAPGQMSSADKTFLDSEHAAKGANLTDADAALILSGGAWRVLPATTLTADRTLTINTTGAVAGSQMTITRLDATAHQLIIVNGGGGAGTLFTMANSKLGWVKLQYDGTNWAVREFGVQ